MDDGVARRGGGGGGGDGQEQWGEDRQSGAVHAVLPFLPGA